MTDAENVMEKAGPKEHKGQYGDTKGKSPNSLYKKYKTWAEDNGKAPMEFPQWMKWAQDKGLLKKNYSADAVTEDKPKDDITPKVKSNVKKYASVAIVVVAIVILYKAYKSEDKK